MEGPRSPRSRCQVREIIEILDDDDDEDDDDDDNNNIENEVISVVSLSDTRESPSSSGIQYLSNSLSPQEEPEVLEDYGLPSPQMPDDDDEWGFEIPRPQPQFEPDLWQDYNPRPGAGPAAVRQAFVKNEPDWGEFLELDNDASPDNRGLQRSPCLGYGLSQGVGQVGKSTTVADAVIDVKMKFTVDVLAVFPDMCTDYIAELYDSGVAKLPEQLIAHVLDTLDSGTEYPKAKDKLKILKRKRCIEDEDEEAVSKYGNVDRENGSHDYTTLTRSILSGEFSQTPMIFIDATLQQTKRFLFPTYMILEEAERTWDPTHPPYNKIKKARTASFPWTSESIEEALNNEVTTDDTMLALRELQTARRARKKAEDKRQAVRQVEIEEEENIKKAEAEGTMFECGCCFSDYPLNRMVHCDADDAPHWFCRDCARQTAETEIGNSRYRIKCMSMDGCESSFSRDMKSQFLDEKTSIALDRNEQEEVLRLAGIENLASCPFCPFAAEYPPVEQDRLFRCQAPDCEKISCRLCKLESHIPKTCEESARDNGLSVRRQIEEAMSAALIRRCNKCNTPFVKDEGCNKMTCTRNGCFNVQCYVCSKSCSYDHFNDRTRGGKLGNCPLFESVEKRHQDEVKKAEAEALAKVRAEHPEYTEEDLKVKVSESVRKDEERRNVNDPRNNVPANGVHHLPPAGGLPDPVRAPGPRAGRRAARRHVEARPGPAPDAILWPVPPDVPIWHYQPYHDLPLQAATLGEMGGILDPSQHYGLAEEWTAPAPDDAPNLEALHNPIWCHEPVEEMPWLKGNDHFLLGFPAQLPPQANNAQNQPVEPMAPRVPVRPQPFLQMQHGFPAAPAPQLGNQNQAYEGGIPGIPREFDFQEQLHQLHERNFRQFQQLQQRQQMRNRQPIPMMHQPVGLQPIGGLVPPAQPAPPAPGNMPLRLSPRR